MQNDLKANSFFGLAIALLIGLLWLSTYISVLQLPSECSYWFAGGLILVLRVFAYTGLFIIAHDSMHQSLMPAYPIVNRLIGQCALMLYAGLLFQSCEANHKNHHRLPESQEDPDYCCEGGQSPVAWYFSFMLNYLNLTQILRLSVVLATCFIPLMIFGEDPLWRLILFCIVPLFLSSVQLFVVGTWLPHRKVDASLGEKTPRSLTLHPLLSFAACFHFGYHREHHDLPEVPWFKLPMVRRQCLTANISQDACH